MTCFPEVESNKGSQCHNVPWIWISADCFRLPNSLSWSSLIVPVFPNLSCIANLSLQLPYMLTIQNILKYLYQGKLASNRNLSRFDRTYIIKSTTGIRMVESLLPFQANIHSHTISSSGICPLMWWFVYSQSKLRTSHAATSCNIQPISNITVTINSVDSWGLYLVEDGRPKIVELSVHPPR